MLIDYLNKIKRIHNVNILKAAIYARYSSDMQRSESIDAQIRFIQNFAKQHNIVIIEQYIDEAQSAKRDNREAFQKMICDSQHSEWHIIIVHKLDRFARNRFDSANYRVILRKNKKYLVSALEQFDDSPESIMLETMIEAMSEYYSKNLAREVMKGLTENVIKGKHCGGVPPLGYELDSSKFYTINDLEAQSVKIIFNRFLEGKSYGEIINELNSLGYRTKRNRLFGKNSIYEILRNEKYTGTYVFNKMQSRDEITGSRSRHRYKTDDEIIRIENVIPAIISKDDFFRVQAILNSRKNAYSNNAKEIYLLSGKIICGICGSHFTGRRSFNPKGKKYVTYTCINKSNANYKCDNSCVNRDWLENIVVEAVREFIRKFNIKYIEQIRKSYIDDIQFQINKEQKSIEKELNNIDSEINKLLDILTLVNSEMVVERIQRLETKKVNLKRDLNQIRNVSDLKITFEKINCLISKAEQMLEEKEVQFKELIDLVVKKIEIDKENIRIYFNCLDESQTHKREY